MPRGPQPADPTSLVRRNKATTASVLDATADNASWPELPILFVQQVREELDSESGKWVRRSWTEEAAYQPATLAWYASMPGVPQDQMLLSTDRASIARTAPLLDAYLSGRDCSPAVFMAVEKSMDRFGFSLEARWRLKLAVDRTVEKRLATVTSEQAAEKRRAERERLKSGA